MQVKFIGASQKKFLTREYQKGQWISANEWLMMTEALCSSPTYILVGGVEKRILAMPDEGKFRSGQYARITSRLRGATFEHKLEWV